MSKFQKGDICIIKKGSEVFSKGSWVRVLEDDDYPYVKLMLGRAKVICSSGPRMDRARTTCISEDDMRLAKPEDFDSISDRVADHHASEVISDQIKVQQARKQAAETSPKPKEKPYPKLMVVNTQATNAGTIVFMEEYGRGKVVHGTQNYLNQEGAKVSSWNMHRFEDYNPQGDNND